MFFTKETKAEEDMFQVTSIDVGKGDCILVQTGDTNVLIDTGYKNTVDDVLSFLNKQKITKLDALIISHFHKDHVGGAAKLLEEIPIGIVYMPDYEGTRSVYREMMEELSKGKIPYKRLTQNMRFSLGEAAYNLYPGQIPFDGDNDNDVSMAVTLEYKGHTALFAGDLKDDGVKQFLSNHQIPENHYDILKLPHHGSCGENTPGLLKRLKRGGIALITDGQDRRADGTLIDTLKKNGFKTCCAAEDGTITITANGAEYTIAKSKNSTYNTDGDRKYPAAEDGSALITDYTGEKTEILITEEKNMEKNTLWSGGRLSAALNQSMADLNRSLDIDKRMAWQDVRGSIAWAKATCTAGILTEEERDLITNGLGQVWTEIREGSFVYQDTDEDIHTAVERRLTEIIGPTGGKLHTGRSRNDQVVTDFRMWMLDTIPELADHLRALQNSFLDRAKKDIDVYLSGYTHFQQAQPILLSHWWMSHFWALDRDRQRLSEAAQHADSLPLGCGALAGTAYPVDRFDLAESLGFSMPSPNSLDAVSDRDFACDFLYWASMLGMHLSRCAEAMILYSTMEFGYITLSDAFSTGSSLMPQKKNPDSLELIRGKAGMQYGHLFSLLSSLKGLPSAYDKDLQEDKQLVFAAADTAALAMSVMKGVLDTLTVNKDRCMALINTQALATDLADYLVKKGMPFREAHHAVGKAVKLSETLKCDLKEIPLEKWKEISELFTDDVYDTFSVENAVDARCAWGGTARFRVMEQIRFAEKVLKNS